MIWLSSFVHDLGYQNHTMSSRRGGDHAPVFQLQEKEDLAMRVNKGFIALTDHY